LLLVALARGSQPDPTLGKLVFLPWGMDLSMKPYRDSGRPHIGLFDIARHYDRAQGRSALASCSGAVSTAAGVASSTADRSLARKLPK
jgi:hypothetical protein